MRSFVPTVVPFIVFIGCNGLEPASEPGLQAESTSDDVVLQPETVLLDQVAGIDEIVVDDGLVTIWSDAPLDAIQVDSVLVGEEARVLARVTGLNREGRRLTLQTERATLTDAVAQGHVNATVALADNRSAESVFDFGGRVLLDTELWSDAEGDYVQLLVQTSEDSRVTWQPLVEYDIDVGFTQVDADFEASFLVDYEADFITTISGAWSDQLELPIETRRIPFTFMMGEVPVWGTAEVNLYAGYAADFAGEATATVHTEAHLDSVASASFYDAWGPDNRRWDTFADATITGDEDGRFIDYSTTAAASGQARAWIRTEVSLELYSSAGAEVTLEPWIAGEMCPDTLESFQATAGVEGSHRYYFEALGWSLYDTEPMPFSWGPWALAECAPAE